MAMNQPLEQNVGSIDRIIRGVFGVWLVMTGLPRLLSLNGLLQIGSGTALIASASTGHCAMMKAMGASTIPGQSNNVMNQLKQAMPGQGINPMQTEQASPQRETRSMNPDVPMAQATAIM